MKKTLLFFSTMITGMLFSTTIFAAAWNVPNNVRVVQLDHTDTNGRIYGSIQAAISSIGSAATATNPYVVKVMPGIYNLGTGSITMKEYVDVEGSGPDNTIITTSNNNADGYSCSVGTVIMANNSSIRNIGIVNMPADQAGAFNAVSALVFNNVKAKAEGVSVLVGSDTVDGGRTNGICIWEGAAHAYLNNVSIETHNIAHQSNAIMLYRGGNLTLTNSKLASFNTGGSIDVINSTPMNILTGTMTVINTTIEGTSPNMVTGIFAEGDKMTVANSTITLNVDGGTGQAIWVSAVTEFAMANTRVVTDGTAQYSVYANPGAVRIANSLLPGDRSGLAGAALFNNYDENYLPITNP